MVIWQDPETRAFKRVGTLDMVPGGEYRFRYDVYPLPGRFRPFRAFPDLTQEYRSTSLFPFVANRVMSERRPDYPAYLAALGLTPATATPLEVLARSGGGRQTDTIQIVPEPTVREDGTEGLLFLVSGVRHIDGAAARVAALRPGQELLIRAEPDNEYDARALLLDVTTGDAVGWIPSYLLDYVHKNLEGGATARVIVEKVNGPDAPWHLRLLCRLEIRRPAA
jgi:hypothetical protein